MPNMPSITLAEIVVVSTAVVILYVVPFVLVTIDQHRRRRPAVWAGTVAMTEPSDQPAAAGTTVDIPSATASEVAQPREQDGAIPDDAASTAGEDGPTTPAAETPELAAPAAADESAPDAPEPGIANAIAFGTDNEGPAFEPFAGDAGCQFRLEDLHRVRLADSTDAAHSHLWRDAERMAEAHRAAVFGCVLLSPYPIRSACCSGVERDDSTLRLRYLLFPSLWPVSRDQAVAHVMFEIDAETGAVRHRLDVLRRCDLTDDTRRAIRDSGGDI
jgi:hypothetical protein